MKAGHIDDNIVLEVRGARKSFGAARGARVAGGIAGIHGVDFALRRGQMLAVLGPSGAGKTTLFRCLAGVSVLDAGAVLLRGADVAALRGRERRHIAIVFQQFHLVGRLSALDNVLAGRLGHAPAWRGWLRRFARADVMLALACLRRVGLLEHAGQRADTLSGGQQQRVAIARALAQQPDIIIADEPVASLDPRTGADIIELLRSICHSDGVAVICSLHQPQLARLHADRVLGLRDGRIVLDTPVRDIDDDAVQALYETSGGAHARQPAISTTQEAE
jgi:phosphonate transport system ATP-binding protein